MVVNIWITHLAIGYEDHGIVFLADRTNGALMLQCCVRRRRRLSVCDVMYCG